MAKKEQGFPIELAIIIILLIWFGTLVTKPQTSSLKKNISSQTTQNQVINNSNIFHQQEPQKQNINGQNVANVQANNNNISTPTNSPTQNINLQDGINKQNNNYNIAAITSSLVQKISAPKESNVQNNYGNIAVLTRSSVKGEENKSLINSPISSHDFIYTDNYANRKLEYYYYIPSAVINRENKNVPFLIMVPGLNGKGEDCVNNQFKEFADKENFVIIAPSFNEDTDNWNSHTSYQYPAAWSGQALNRIVQSFIEKQKITPATSYLYGFSAGAQFVSRYAQLFPNLVTACAINSAGGSDYPSRYQPTKFFIAVGEYDEAYRQIVAKEFYCAAKQAGIDIIYKTYKIGHTTSDEETRDEIEFFTQVKHSNW